MSYESCSTLAESNPALRSDMGLHVDSARTTTSSPEFTRNTGSPAASYHPQATVFGVGMITWVRPGAGAGQVVELDAPPVLIVRHAPSVAAPAVHVINNARLVVIRFSPRAVRATKIHLIRKLRTQTVGYEQSSGGIRRTTARRCDDGFERPHWLGARSRARGARPHGQTDGARRCRGPEPDRLAPRRFRRRRARGIAARGRGRRRQPGWREPRTALDRQGPPVDRREPRAGNAAIVAHDRTAHAEAAADDQRVRRRDLRKSGRRAARRIEYA